MQSLLQSYLFESRLGLAAKALTSVATLFDAGDDASLSRSDLTQLMPAME